ncbi:DUF7408 domain-containing protein [Saccharibacillus kuerlensis]|uniref:DUF7408 domain-containing protein n=1 Tax=Saccharibacillus kuerlensis TaxID=459527 RepID=A0ABQ2L368_9BACL|nr:hypothetical protein [Saccharibacillus kuerlensis]GGN99447.1 hypothetical protein GCM10010969_19570 [Saccharibacillus kuerlensis]
MFAWGKRTGKKSMALMQVLILIAVMLPILPVGANAAGNSAEGGLRVATEFGYGGKVNEGRMNPLKVTLTSDRDLTGDLVVQITPQNGMGESTYVRRVELPAGTAKEVTIAVPGGSYSRNTSMLRFYPGSIEKGDSLPFREGRAYLTSSTQYGGIVGVLASDPDTMNFLSLLQGSGQIVSIIPLEADDISENPMMLDGLDVLVMNDFASDTLSEAQLEAIRSWINSGGSLVLGGGAGYGKTAAGLEDLSPVEVTGGTESVSAAPLASGGGGKELPADASITAAKASVKPEAEVRYSSGQLPLIASMQAQSGRVWYAAYDLSLEPLSSWAGSASLWGKLLLNPLNVSIPGGGMYGSSFNSNLYNLSYILDYFPSLHMPKLSILVWMLLIYVVIVAPLLYLVLRKFDKREWAWVFIPLVAVISSAAIYMAGSSDKTKELAHTLSYVTLNGEGEGIRKSATALFVPSAGNYTVDFPAGTQLTMMNNDGWMVNNGGVSGELKNYVRQENDAVQLRLGGMPYWSVSKFNVEEPGNVETGKLDSQLSVDEQGTITGSIVNDTGVRLTDAGLVAGGKLYKLGTLEPGAEASLGKGMSLSGGYYDIGSYLFANQTSVNDPYVRQRSMVQNIPIPTGGGVQNSFLIAFSEDSKDTLSVGGKTVANDRLSMYTQAISVDLVQDGAINIPYGYIGGSIIHTNTTQVSDDGSGRISASPGSMTLGYSLPNPGKAEYEQLDIRLTEGQSQTTTFEIWNETEGEWEAISWKNGGAAASYTNAADYVADDLVQIRVRVNAWTNMVLPEIKLKGAVQS